MFDDTRSTWGARSPKKPSIRVAPADRTEFFNHYDGGHPLGLAGKPHSACLEQVRKDQAFHMDGNGWSDIGYNGLVCPHGRAIEGRGIDAIGAHCPDHNTTGYGFQFMVGGNETPTPAAYSRMAKLYADCVARSGHALAKKGHRDGFATACPGDIVQAWVKAGMRAVGGPATPPVAPIPQEDDMPSVKEVADEILSRPVYDLDGKKVTVGQAIGISLRNSQLTGRLAKASAEAGRPLTANEIDDIAKATVDALGDGYDATITLTQKETP